MHFETRTPRRFSIRPLSALIPPVFVGFTLHASACAISLFGTRPTVLPKRWFSSPQTPTLSLYLPFTPAGALVCPYYPP